MNNQEPKIRPAVINVNSNEPLFYSYSVKISKCWGSCNNINDPYSKLCVRDIVKNINIEVFNLMSRTNETGHIEWHETCKCKCRLMFVIINNIGTKLNVVVNIKNWSTKEGVIKDLFGNLVFVNVNVINWVT